MYCKGTYYPKLPNNNYIKIDGEFKQQTIEKYPITYNPTDERFRRYETIDGIESSGKVLTIETRTKCDYLPKAHIATQNGELWQIISVRETTANKNPLRNFTTSINTKYVISLVSVDNPWELK